MLTLFLLPLSSYLLFLSILFIPLIGCLIALYSPILLINYLLNPLREKRNDILFLLFLAATLLIPFIGFYSNLFYIFFVIIPSISIYNEILNYKSKKDSSQSSFNKAIIYSPLPFLILAIISIILLQEARLELINYISTGIESLKLEADLLANKEFAYMMYIINNSKKIATTMVYLLPGMSYAYIISMLYLTCKYFFRKLQIKLYFKMPEYLMILFVCCGFLVLSSNTAAKYISFNTIIIFSTIFFLQGIDIINYFLKKIKSSNFIRFITYFLILTQLPITIIVSFLGLIDNWFKFIKDEAS